MVSKWCVGTGSGEERPLYQRDEGAIPDSGGDPRRLAGDRRGGQGRVGDCCRETGYLMRLGTQEMLGVREVKGEATDASSSEREIPLCARFRAWGQKRGVTQRRELWETPPRLPSSQTPQSVQTKRTKLGFLKLIP